MSMETQVVQKIKENNLIEANIKIIGDESTLADVVKLLAFIRHSIKNKEKTDVHVEIGKRVNSDFFDFSVNNLEIRDYLPLPSIKIN